MICPADKYLAQQHREGTTPGPLAQGPVLPVFSDRTAMHWMTTIQHETLQNLSMTPRRPTPKSLKMTLKRTMPLWVPIQPTSPVGMILIGPIEPT